MHEELMVWFSRAVVHSLWEGAAIGAGAWLAARLVRNSPARQHAVWCAALLAMAVILPANLVVLAPDGGAWQMERPRPASEEVRPGGTGQAEVAAEWTSTISDGGVARQGKGPFETATFGWHEAAPWVVAVYGTGLLVMLLRAVLSCCGSRRLRRGARAVTEGPWKDCLGRMRTRLKLTSEPVLAWSAKVAAPALAGVCKPIILLPVALANRLSMEQAEAVLAHELAHLARRDHWVLTLQRLVETLLFYHPVTWWVSRELGRAREQACDDLVMASGLRPADYAEALVLCSELQVSAAHGPDGRTMQLAATGRSVKSLRQRVLRILGEEDPIRPGRGAWWQIAVVGVGLLGLGLVLQPAARAQESEDSKRSELPSEEQRESSVAESVVGEDGNPEENAAAPPAVLVDQQVDPPGVFVLLPDGEVRWQGKVYSLAQLKEALPAEGGTAVIKAPPETPYRLVVELLELLRPAYSVQMEVLAEGDRPGGEAPRDDRPARHSRLAHLQQEIDDCEAERARLENELARFPTGPKARQNRQALKVVNEHLRELEVAKRAQEAVEENRLKILDLQAKRRTLLAGGLGEQHPSVQQLTLRISSLQETVPDGDGIPAEMELRHLRLEQKQLEDILDQLRGTGHGPKHPKVRMTEQQLRMVRERLEELQGEAANHRRPTGEEAGGQRWKPPGTRYPTDEHDATGPSFATAMESRLERIEGEVDAAAGDAGRFDDPIRAVKFFRDPGTGKADQPDEPD